MPPLFGLQEVGRDPAAVNDAFRRGMALGNVYYLNGVRYRYVKNADTSAFTAKLIVVWKASVDGQAMKEVVLAAVGDAGKAYAAGLAQAAVSAGNFGMIGEHGPLTAVADAAVTRGDRVTIGGTTAGRLKKAAAEGDLGAGISGDFIVGQCLETAAVGANFAVAMLL